jgi:hypothetical protein
MDNRWTLADEDAAGDNASEVKIELPDAAPAAAGRFTETVIAQLLILCHHTLIRPRRLERVHVHHAH